MIQRLLLPGLLFLVVLGYSQGWRTNEMQVRIEIDQQFDPVSIHQIVKNAEVVPGDPAFLRAYVIPRELSMLRDNGFNITIEISDLNEWSEQHLNSRDAYHSYDEIIELADSLATHFPSICKKYIFGTSVEGRQLAALKISDNVETDENEAEIMFDGGIHGDEIGAAENVIRFARYLCLDYETDPYIEELVNNREIWLYLMVNPDGRYHDVRYNANGVDLNRDWGFMWDAWGGSPGAFSQPESRALRACSFNNQFVVHTTYHSGTEYISLPWSYRPDQPHDWEHIYDLAEIYHSESGYSNLEFGQGYNGMYAINGSTKDSNYGIMGSISWSMEISYDKHPPTSQIQYYYSINKPSMLAMIEHGGYGISGTVTDEISGDPVTALIFVDDSYPCYTDPIVGDYHKYLIPGTYDLTVMANGYETQTIQNVVVQMEETTVTNIELSPQEGQYVYRFSASQIPDNNHADEGWTPAVFGSPDNINYSLGKNGWCVLDMQYPLEDGPGNDFIIYEGDSSPEGYTVSVSDTIDGPWHEIGTGNGTMPFDISVSGMYSARYIKIEDDGDGSSNGNDVGFDLDAIEVLPPEPGIYISLMQFLFDDSNGNNNGIIDAGEEINLSVTIKNSGDTMAPDVLGNIDSQSTFINILNGDYNFGDLDIEELAEGTFSFETNVDTPPGSSATIILNISADNGNYYNQYNFDIVIGQIPVAIIDLDPNHSSGPEIQTAIEENDITVEYLTELPSSLSVYNTLFVCLGIYSDNHTLSGSEGQSLADFLSDGGNLYMEGGDTWAFDTQTAVHAMFNINGTDDGSSDLGTINGFSGTFTEGMSFSYSGENNWIDHLAPLSTAFSILANQSPSYNTAIAFEGNDYKTIGASHEFGGLDDGTSPSTKAELMAAYLEFFGVGTAQLFANFYADETEICQAGEVQFNDLSTGPVVSWYWEFEGGSPATSTNQNPLITYTESGNFDVSLTVSDGTNQHTSTIEDYIAVLQLPETPEQPDGPTEICVNFGYNTDYTVPYISGATSYNWVLEPSSAGVISGDGPEISIDWDDLFQGNATLSVAAENLCGEGGYSEILEIYCYICDGIDETSQNKFTVYPNPNTGTFMIDSDNIISLSSNLEIYSETGISVPFALSSNNTVKLLYPEHGIYFVRINLPDEFKVIKFIIR